MSIMHFSLFILTEWALRPLQQRMLINCESRAQKGEGHPEHNIESIHLCIESIHLFSLITLEFRSSDHVGQG